MSYHNPPGSPLSIALRSRILSKTYIVLKSSAKDYPRLKKLRRRRRRDDLKHRVGPFGGVCTRWVIDLLSGITHAEIYVYELTSGVCLGIFRGEGPKECEGGSAPTSSTLTYIGRIQFVAIHKKYTPFQC